MGGQPVHGRNTPAIARLESLKLELGPGCAQVVTDLLLKLQKLLADDRADRVRSKVLGAGPATAVAVEARQRIMAAGLEFRAEDVPIHRSGAAFQRGYHLGGEPLKLPSIVEEWVEQDQLGAGVRDLSKAFDTF